MIVLMATTRICRAGVLVPIGLGLAMVAATCGCAIQYSWGPFGGGPRSLPSPTGQPPVCTHRRQLLDPVCYGYRQTCWMAWPGTCPACPPPESCPHEPSVAPEKLPDESPLPKLPPPADKTFPEPPSPPKQTPEPAPVPPEPMPTTEPGPLGTPAVPIPLDGADKQQKPKPKQTSPDQRQQNGLPKNGTPDKPAEKPSPFDEEPIPPKPPMSQATDQSQSRAASVRDGTASAPTNRTGTATYNTGAIASTIQQPAERRTSDIAVRLSQSSSGDTGASATRVGYTPRQSSQPAQGDSRTVLERRSSPVREQQASTSSGVRNPNLPTLAERLRQQAAQAHSQAVSSSQAVAAAQPAGAPEQPAASASTAKAGSGQLARTQPAATQSLAAPLPPPLRTLGDSNPAARPPTDGKIAAAKPGVLLLGYRTGEE